MRAVLLLSVHHVQAKLDTLTYTHEILHNPGVGRVYTFIMTCNDH